MYITICTSKVSNTILKPTSKIPRFWQYYWSRIYTDKYNTFIAFSLQCISHGKFKCSNSWCWRNKQWHNRLFSPNTNSTSWYVYTLEFSILLVCQKCDRFSQSVSNIEDTSRVFRRQLKTISYKRQCCKYDVIVWTLR